MEIQCQLLDIMKSISGFRGLKSVGSSANALKMSVTFERRAYVSSRAVHASSGTAETEFRRLQSDRGPLCLYVLKVKVQISLKAYGRGWGYGSIHSYSLHYVLHASAVLAAVWAPEPVRIRRIEPRLPRHSVRSLATMLS
jgi:hypothetical protein